LWRGEQESEVPQDSPFYTQVRAVKDARPPLDSGFFEIPLPAKLFEGNPREITLEWIDFYRN
jgi:hypothetical protein